MFGDGIDRKALVCMAAINTWYKVAYGKLQVCGENGEHCDDSRRLLIQQTKAMYYRLCDVDAAAKKFSAIIDGSKTEQSRS